jgi:hypothetical protein
MAIKILKGGFKPDLPDTGLGSSQDTEDWGQTIGRNVARIPVKAAEMALGGAGSLSNLALQGLKMLPDEEGWLNLPERIPLPTVNEVSEFIEPKLEKGLGLSKDYFKAREDKFMGIPVEKVIDKFAMDLPIIFMSGGASLAGQLAGSAGSNLAMQGAEELGMGPFGQIMSAFTGGSLARAAGKKVLPGSLKKMAFKEFTENEIVAQRALKTLNNPRFKSENTINQLDKIFEEAQGLGPKFKKEVMPDLMSLQNKMNRGELSIKDAWDKKKEFYDLAYKNRHGSDKSHEIFKSVGKTLKDFLNEASEAVPEWGVPFQKYEDYYRGYKAQSSIRKMLEDSTTAKKIASAHLIPKALVLGGAWKVGGLPGAAAAIPASLFARSIARGADLVMNSKNIRKHLSDVAEYAILGDKKGFLNSFNKLNDEVVLEAPEENGVKVLSGGFR